MKYKQEVEFIDLPETFINLAIRRTSPMMRLWAIRGTDSLQSLMASAYLQGVKDGFDTAEKQQSKEKNGCRYCR